MGASSYTYAEASWTQSLPGKQAEVLGGLGSILGAFWGGHLIGIVRSARPTWLELERAGRSLSRRETEVGFAPDSVLEGDGFELSVPPEGQRPAPDHFT
jgi:ABC-type branched-subunit amino acid transport system permease subunit